MFQLLRHMFHFGSVRYDRDVTDTNAGYKLMLIVDDPQNKRSLADDPNFLASLEDLDRGLVEEPPPSAARRSPRSGARRSASPWPQPPRATLPPAAAPPRPRRRADPAAGRAGTSRPRRPAGRRPLLDLFPPTPERDSVQRRRPRPPLRLRRAAAAPAPGALVRSLARSHRRLPRAARAAAAGARDAHLRDLLRAQRKAVQPLVGSALPLSQHLARSGRAGAAQRDPPPRGDRRADGRDRHGQDDALPRRRSTSSIAAR